MEQARSMKASVGSLLFAFGIIHQVVGVFELRDELAAVWPEGL
jgi:hypothetical protein